MRIGIFGRGRLGRAIAAEAGGEVAWQVGREAPPAGPGREPVEVAIDASAAAAVEGHLAWALDSATPLVIGTTGWAIPDLASRVGDRIGLLVAPNFSLTVAFLARLARLVGAYAALDPERDPYLAEHHHRHKADAPSGTARLLAGSLIESCPRKTAWTMGTPAGPHELSLGVIRAGAEFGTHLVGFDSPGEVLEIRHTARSRAPFAQGALLAARWILGRKGLFTIDDLARGVLDPIFATVAAPEPTPPTAATGGRHER